MQIAYKKAEYGFTLASDTTSIPHDKVGIQIYKYRSIIKDVATKYHCSFALTDKTATQMARRFNYGVRIQYANSKCDVTIAECDHQEFKKHAYFCQDAENFYLLLTDKSRAWFKEFYINDNIFNNTSTLLIDMFSNEAVKKALKGKKIIARSLVKHRRLVDYNEPLLPSYTKVQHLLEPSELEVGRRRTTDCNWFSEVFTIDSYLIKENQPILYKLYKGPRHSFVREELQIVPLNTVLPSKYILKN
ncbi:hypothetical protein C1646_755878 [Rhizophagus diaphanus]|nr:hypothetical protein C1646_755878 [Rhizophagus diaphanus] [Rhizophagus sp. MUCL 43196]